MDYRLYPGRRQLAAAAFGKMLWRWRTSNDWSCHIGYQWAKEARFVSMAPSTLLLLESGKARNPQPQCFFALGEINRRLAARDYSGEIEMATRAYIEDAEPLRGDDGRSWSPVDLWSCYTGLLAVPQAYAE